MTVVLTQRPRAQRPAAVPADRQRHARWMAYLGCAGAFGYGAMKVVWALGGTIGIRNPKHFHAVENVRSVGQRFFDHWGTPILAGLAIVVLLGLIYPWGNRAILRPLLRTLAWPGSLMAAVGVLGLIGIILYFAGDRGIGRGDLYAGAFLFTYICFLMLGVGFAGTGWMTRQRPRRSAARALTTATDLGCVQLTEFGGDVMKIEYLHASKYGNGAAVAAEFKRQMTARGVGVDVHHIRDMNPTELPAADLYLFSSPGRIGKPIGGMRRFLKKVSLPPGTRYAILTTEATPKPDKKTGRLPSEEELAKYQRVRPIMNEILQGMDLVKVAEGKVHVTRLKGPLEEGWQEKVKAFVARIPAGSAEDAGEAQSARRQPSVV